MREVAIIGAGAAGMAAALSVARYGGHAHLYEAGERVGQSILRTGNGRCNLTNKNVEPDAYNAPAFVAPTLENYGFERVLSFFEQGGLLTRETDDGRIYPRSNSASTVLDVLRLHCRQKGVAASCSFEVIDFNRKDDGFVIMAANGTIAKSSALIVATGGASQLLNAAGHHFAPFRPVLCSLKTTTDKIRGLSGVRVSARVSAFDRLQSQTPYASECGEVLFRDYGLSGIVIFNMSRLVSAGHILSLDLLPDLDVERVEELLMNHYEVLTATGAPYTPSNVDVLTGMFHPRVCAAIARAAGVRPAAAVGREGLSALAQMAKDLRVKVEGVGDARNAQVTRGGALLEEFDPHTLQSRLVPHLFAAGETLNVDGRCGGFNLHWAWASGTVAGYNAVMS